MHVNNQGAMCSGFHQPCNLSLPCNYKLKSVYLHNFPFNLFRIFWILRVIWLKLTWLLLVNICIISLYLSVSYLLEYAHIEV